MNNSLLEDSGRVGKAGVLDNSVWFVLESIGASEDVQIEPWQLSI